MYFNAFLESQPCQDDFSDQNRIDWIVNDQHVPGIRIKEVKKYMAKNLASYTKRSSSYNENNFSINL